MAVRPSWHTALAPLPATRRCVDRIREVCFTSRGAFVAHHYTRYLGDLSGGQIIRHKLRAIYDLTGDGLRFYGVRRPGLLGWSRNGMIPT